MMPITQVRVEGASSTTSCPFIIVFFYFLFVFCSFFKFCFGFLFFFSRPLLFYTPYRHMFDPIEAHKPAPQLRTSVESHECALQACIPTWQQSELLFSSALTSRSWRFTQTIRKSSLFWEPTWVLKNHVPKRLADHICIFRSHVDSTNDKDRKLTLWLSNHCCLIGVHFPNVNCKQEVQHNYCQLI